MIFCTLNMYLKESNITQTKLAQMTGVTRPTLNQLIKNENQSIRYDLIEDLCNIFDLHLSDLLKQTKRNLNYLYTTVDSDVGLSIKTGEEFEVIDITSIFTYGKNIRLEFNGSYSYSLTNEDYRNSKKVVILKCYLADDDYEIVLNELIKTHLLDDFIETFDIKEQISEEHDFRQEFTQRFIFDVSPYTNEQRLKEYLKTLSDEEIDALLQKASQDLENNKKDDE